MAWTEAPAYHAKAAGNRYSPRSTAAAPALDSISARLEFSVE